MIIIHVVAEHAGLRITSEESRQTRQIFSTKNTACLPYWKMLDHAEGTPFGSADATAAMKHLSPQDFCGSGRLFHADALHGDVVRITPTGVRDFILQAMGTGKYQNRDLRKTIVMSVNIVP